VTAAAANNDSPPTYTPLPPPTPPPTNQTKSHAMPAKGTSPGPHARERPGRTLGRKRRGKRFVRRPRRGHPVPNGSWCVFGTTPSCTSVVGATNRASKCPQRPRQSPFGSGPRPFSSTRASHFPPLFHPRLHPHCCSPAGTLWDSQRTASPGRRLAGRTACLGCDDDDDDGQAFV